jgi:hypothetical protein
VGPGWWQPGLSRRTDNQPGSSDARADSNACLTGASAALSVLLTLEGATALRVRAYGVTPVSELRQTRGQSVTRARPQLALTEPWRNRAGEPWAPVGALTSAGDMGQVRARVVEFAFGAVRTSGNHDSAGQSRHRHMPVAPADVRVSPGARRWGSRWDPSIQSRGFWIAGPSSSHGTMMSRPCAALILATIELRRSDKRRGD